MSEKLSRAPMTHTVKCVPPFFEEVWTGRKGFEIRLNDRDFRDGDTIIQREYMPDAQEYTGRETMHRVGYVLRDYPALAENHVAFTLLPCAARAEARPAPVVGGEVAWLIEEWDSKRDALKARWWTLDGENGEWTQDSTRALRFARKADAQAYINSIGWSEAKPTEHEWCLPPSADHLGEALSVGLSVFADTSLGMPRHAPRHDTALPLQEEARPATIDTAPRDGRWIIGWRMNFLPSPTRWHPYSGRGGLGPGWWGYEPTHWLPFPTEQIFEDAAQ